LREVLSSYGGNRKRAYHLGKKKIVLNLDKYRKQ